MLIALRLLLVLGVIAGALFWLLLLMAVHDLGSPSTPTTAATIRLAALPVVLLAVLLTAILPPRRWLLHIGAIAVGAFAVGAALVARESLILAAVGLTFAGLWFTFYVLSLRMRRQFHPRHLEPPRT